MAVLAPIPRPSTTSAMIVNRGDLNNERMAYRRSESMYPPSYRLRYASNVRLLLDDGAVGPPHFAPTAVEVVALTASAAAAVRVLRRGLLVDFDTPARGIVRICVAVLRFGTAVEDLLKPLVERRVLLNAEV